MGKDFICILGIDGSGKSTLAERLKKKYIQNNIEYRYIWGGCHHYISFPFVAIGKRIFLKKTNQFENYNNYHEKIKETSKNSLILTLYENMIIFDYFLQILFKIQLPLLFGQGVITDRYVYGTVIDMAANFGYTEEKRNNMINKTLKYFPKPEYTFFIDVPEDIAYSRKDDIPSIEYLKLRRSQYLSLINGHNIILLDGLKDSEELEKIVFETIAFRC